MAAQINLYGTVREMTLAYVPHTETFTGANASGSDAATGRVITLANTSLSLSNAIIVFKSGVPLHLTDDFTVTHNSSASTVTFVGPLWNTEQIDIIYYTN